MVHAMDRIDSEVHSRLMPMVGDSLSIKLGNQKHMQTKPVGSSFGRRGDFSSEVDKRVGDVSLHRVACRKSVHKKVALHAHHRSCYHCAELQSQSIILAHYSFAIFRMKPN